ncbi:MAG: hypothetical protein RJA07_265 [Bacteroidota bacterium]|jgi:hypothetical protein
MKKILFICIALMMAIAVKAQPPGYPYCSPSNNHTTPVACISNVTLNTLNNSTGCMPSSPWYLFYNMTTTLSPGVTYPVTVLTTSGSAIVSVWIDFDQNGVFDTYEWVQPYTSGNSGLANIVVPTNALTGTTYMRVRSRSVGNINGAVDACTTFGSGETEDYVITIASPYSKDLGVQSLITPTSSCGLTNQETVSAIFFNGGVDTIFSFTAKFNINNGFSTASELVNDTILPQSQYNYTFTTKGDFSTAGVNSVDIIGLLVPFTPPIVDSNSVNDTIHRFINHYLLINSFPFIEDFNSGALSIAARTYNASQAQSFVCPFAAHNSTNGFLMTGSSGNSFITPTLGTEWTMNQSSSSTLDYCVDATDTANLHCGMLLKFDLKQTATYDEKYSSFRVLVNGVQVSPTYHPTIANIGTSLDPFIRYTINLQSFIGTAFNLTFESRNKYDTLTLAPLKPGDNAFIDNIRIGPNPPIDLTTVRILNPSSNCVVGSDSVVAVFQNTGCNTLLAGTQIPLNFKLNSIPLFNEIYTLPANLAFNDSFTFTFPLSHFNTTVGYYALKVFTTMPNDGDPFNDADSINFVKQPVINIFPHHQSFDTITGIYWLSSPVVGIDNWNINLGAMTGSPWLTGPHTGSGFANFSYNHAANNEADLISPCLDFSSLNHPSLKFWLDQYAFASAGAYIKPYISINGGITYTQIDSINILSNTASTAGWFQFQVCLDAYAHQPDVKLKFRAHTNAIQNVSLDDVLIEDVADTNLVTVVSDTVCSGSHITALVHSTVAGRKYFITDQNNAVLTPKKNGNGGTLTLTTTAPVSNSFTLKIGFTDSLPRLYCEFYMHDTIPIKVYQQTQAMAGHDTALCFGAITTLNAQGGLTYQWTPSVGLSNPNKPNPTVNITSTTTYILVANNPANCPTNDTITISITPNPTAFAGVDKITCGISSPAIIGGLPAAINGSIPYTYNWTPAIGFITSSTSPNPSVAPSVTTAYILTVSDNNACTATDTVVVTADTPISYTLSSTNITCNGLANGSASISITGGTNPLVLWGTSPTSSVNPITNLAPNKYMVYITDALGCNKLDSVIITQPNSLSLSLLSSNTTCGLCNGNIATVITGGSSPFNYNWSNGTHNDSIINACNGKYSVTIIDASGCSKTDSTAVTGPGGSAAFKIDAGKDIDVCQGYSAYIGGVPTLSGGSMPYSYQWTPNNFLSSSTSSNPFVILPTTTTTYFVTASDGNGCVKTDSVKITVHPLPIANAGSNITYCKQANAIIGAPATPGLTYLWTPSAGLTSATIANPTVNITASETYTVTATDAKGCFSTDQIVVTVNPEPIINAGSDVFCFNNVPVSLSAGGASNFIWSPPYGLSTTFGSSVQANPTSTTTYVVTGIDANGCSSTDDVVVYVLSTGIDEISSAIDLKIYPNPFQQNTSIEFNLTEMKDVKILLLNVQGQLLNTLMDENKVIGSHKLSLNAEGLAAGQYILFIKTNDGMVVKKIIKQE